MFYLNPNIELDAALLKKMFNRFNLEVAPRLRKYRDYYNGKHEILKKSYADPTKPCNKTVINYVKNICDIYCGYLSSPGYISYTSDDDIEEVMNILRYNDYQTQDSDFLLDALIYGVAAELMYIDENAQTRFRSVNPLGCFGICDDSLTGDLLYFVRFYKENEWDDSNTFLVDVYGNTTIKHYRMAGENGALTFIHEEPHYFSQVPANIFALPDEKSIFDCVMTLQDTINQIVSSETDDLQSFVDAYLTITGADLDEEDAANMRQNRILQLPEGATAAWLTKNANDAQIENILKRLHESIYRIAACPDFSSESFVAGVSSGIAIKYRLTGCETRAGKIEGAMKKALQRRVELICGVAALKLGENIFRDIKIDFKRNIPEDLNATINLINGLKGSVSDKTLLSLLPFVEDTDAELEALDAQKQANMAMYSFGSPVEEDDEE